MKFYKTDEQTKAPVEVDKTEWRATVATTDPVIARDVVQGVVIETFFRGYDASSGNKEPELWRTCARDTAAEGWPPQLRYKTEAEALAGHADFVSAFEKLEPEVVAAGITDSQG